VVRLLSARRQKVAITYLEYRITFNNLAAYRPN